MKRIFEIDPLESLLINLIPKDKRLQEYDCNRYDLHGNERNFEEGYSGDSLQGILSRSLVPDTVVGGGRWISQYFVTPNAPSLLNWNHVNGEKVDLAKVKFSDFELSLDMHQGLLSRSFIYEGKDVKVKLEFERFLHIVQKEAALIKVKATVLEGHAKIDFDSTLDGTVVNEDSNYGDRFWIPLGEDKDEKTIQVKTKKSI